MSSSSTPECNPNLIDEMFAAVDKYAESYSTPVCRKRPSPVPAGDCCCGPAKCSKSCAVDLSDVQQCLTEACPDHLRKFLPGLLMSLEGKPGAKEIVMAGTSAAKFAQELAEQAMNRLYFFFALLMLI